MVIQDARVIVNAFREQARSYSGQWAVDPPLLFTTQVGYQAAVLLLLILILI